MTVLLAYASPPELAIVLGMVAVALGLLAVALRPSRRPAPRPTRTVHVTITPDARVIQHVRFGRPKSHLRTLGPRPFDWQQDDPDLGDFELAWCRPTYPEPRFAPADVARIMDLDPASLGLPLGHPPARIVVDETPLLDRGRP